MTSPLDDFGQFADLAPLLVLKQRLEEAARLHVDDGDLVWVLPSSTLEGVTAAYGIPVIRAEVPEPMLAIRQKRNAGS